MKMNKTTSLLFVFSLFSVTVITACSAEPAEKEDTSWIYESVEDYNKQTIRQMTSTTITETEGGTYTQESLLVYDFEKELAYVENREEGPNNYQCQVNSYYYLEDGQGYLMTMTINGDAESTSSDYQKASVDKAFVESAFQSTSLLISDKATVKNVGYEKLDDRDVVKVTVSDTEFERLLDNPGYAALYKSVKEEGKHAKELEKAYDAYVKMKEREWTIWFDKETRKPVKTETDSSVMYNLFYYIVLVNAVEEDQAPIHKMTTSYIILGDGSENLEIPKAYVEAK